ncbi:hypothetical protein [Rodentibacter myodis]|uniref:Uncharacterized protein n=1 Tax=Rodentibacter myodis TaxID=1907939 RepID=A0A1V3JQR8_9PAST|nr:hypothetical protein [Rodentibacter myodis]OOF58622.1 hypothetical protein BKL49_06865 [Rodentibacter myodis]
MKKYLGLVSVAAFLLSGANVVVAKEADKAKMQKSNTPEIYLSVFDASKGLLTDLNTTQVSRSNPNLQLCWAVQGSFSKKVNVIETMKAPEKQTIVAKGAKVSSSDGRKTNVIQTSLESANQGKIVGNCWRFDEQDPIGKYTLQVQVMNKFYKPMSFSVVK